MENLPPLGPRRAHTNEIDLRKKNCFRFAKIFAFGDGAEVISSALFFSDFKFFRPSEALARENFPISNVSRPRVVLYFLLSLARYTRLLSLVYFYMGMENLSPLGPRPRVGDQKVVAVCFAQPLSCCFIRF